MLFNSLEFMLVFLPVTFFGFLMAVRHNRVLGLGWLVCASLFFYGWWNPVYVWLIVGSMAVNYSLGWVLCRKRSVYVLSAGVGLNLATLGYYKYIGLFSETLGQLADAQMGFQDVVLPLAISFFTFQQISYLVDAYNGKVDVGNWVEYALFVTFFPQLIAGPIVRHSEIMPQFLKEHLGPRGKDIAIGISVFAVGLFKKVVIADTLAIYASTIFNVAAKGAEVTFLDSWSGALAYSLQIYFDFSGYSDMAIGLGRLFGFRLPINFFSPYKSLNIIEFWQRWHITLSRFLREYLYYPLGGNKVGQARQFINIMTVMLLGGLWHGAGWNFLLWGGMHGGFILVNHVWQNFTRTMSWQPGRWLGLWRVLSFSLTFLCITVAWVLFRADNLDVAMNVYRGMAGLDGRFVLPATYENLLSPIVSSLGLTFVHFDAIRYFEGMREIGYLAVVLFLALILPNTQEWMSRWGACLEPIQIPNGTFTRMLLWRPSMVYLFVVVTILTVAVSQMFRPTEFLYFQF